MIARWSRSRMLGRAGQPRHDLSKTSAMERRGRRIRAALALDPDYPYLRGFLFFFRLNCCDWQAYEKQRDRMQKGASEGKRIIQPLMNLAISETARTAVAMRARSGRTANVPWQRRRFGEANATGMSGYAWRICRRISARIPWRRPSRRCWNTTIAGVSKSSRYGSGRITGAPSVPASCALPIGSSMQRGRAIRRLRRVCGAPKSISPSI